MEFWNKLLTQLSALWERWSSGQRAAIILALVVSVATIVGVGIWTTSPEYVVLSDHLSPQQSAEIITTLESEGVKYQLNFAGSAISVPRQDVGRARLALKDVISVPAQPEESFSDGIWSDPAAYQARMTRQLEGRLARTIGQIATVRSATVHITRGETSPFIRNRSPSKASVILELQPSAMFSAADARSVIALVAHSVEQLDPENVSVLDTNGRLLSGAQGVDADVGGQLAYRTRVESDLASKAETILTQMLGPGRAVVRVTADIDFTEIQRKETRFDPSLKVKVSETILSESHTGAGKSTGGAVGAKPNMGSPDAKSDGAPSGGSKVENTTTTFENAKTEDVVHEAPGRIKRLTVAAVVQLPAADADDAKTGPVATREQVEAIIKQAVGFDASRMDQIEVLPATLAGMSDLTQLPVGGSGWEKYESLLRTASLGLAAVVALFLGLMVLRRMKPIVVETESKQSLSSDVVRRLATLSQQAQENPDAAAEVVRSWLRPAAAETTQKKAAA